MLFYEGVEGILLTGKVGCAIMKSKGSDDWFKVEKSIIEHRMILHHTQRMKTTYDIMYLQDRSRDGL